MEKTLTVRGRYLARKFIPDGPLPDEEGTAEPSITPTRAQARGSIAEAFGSAAVPRSGDDILAQVRAERDQWGDR
jgi:hypothetical protein